MPVKIDLDFLLELSENDSKYVFEVLDIFLNTIPEGVQELYKLATQTDDWDAIYKQAHFLKSSTGIVRINDIYTSLEKTEELARKNKQLIEQQKEIDNNTQEEIKNLATEILQIFQEAHPSLILERDKYKALAT